MQYPIQVVEISVQILGHQCSSSIKFADSVYSRVDFKIKLNSRKYMGVALPTLPCFKIETVFNNFETFSEKLTATRVV